MIKGINSLHSIYKKIIMFLIILTITSLSISFVRASSGDTYKVRNAIFPKIYSVNNDFIYYTSLYDNKIYRLNIKTNDRIEILSDIVNDRGIILWNQWIYYINNSDNTLYRIKEDGSSKTSLGGGRLQTGSDSFFVWENHLYYIDSKFILHKFNTYGEEIKITDDKEFEVAFKLNSKTLISNKWLYVPSWDGIIKVNNETGESIKLCEDRVYDGITIKDNWIYYINQKDYKLYKVSTESMERFKISEDVVITEGADYDTGSFYIVGDTIYYTCDEDRTIKLVKSNIDGENRSIISDKVVDFIISDKYIYYVDDVDNGGLFKVNLDGSERRKVVNGAFIPFISLEEKFIVYATKSEDINQPYNGRLFIIDQNGKMKNELK